MIGRFTRRTHAGLGAEGDDPDSSKLPKHNNTLKTIYYTASSLDGFIADPAQTLDWLLQFPAPAGEIERFLSTVGAVAMGSTTYEWLLKHHVDPNTRQPLPWPYAQPTWVFTTRTLPAVPNADIRFATGDVRPVH